MATVSPACRGTYNDKKHSKKLSKGSISKDPNIVNCRVAPEKEKLQVLGHQAKDQSLQNCATWDLGSEELADTFAELYPELSQSFTADESKLGTNSEGPVTSSSSGDEHFQRVPENPISSKKSNPKKRKFKKKKPKAKMETANEDSQVSGSSDAQGQTSDSVKRKRKNRTPKKVVRKRVKEIKEEPSDDELFSPEKEKLGSWAQCSVPLCGKWRYLKTKVDPTEIPERWVCAMNPDPLLNTCNASQEMFDSQDEDYDVVYSPYPSGAIVWAKLAGYPWWPAMMQDDPDYDCYYESRPDSRTPVSYHVVFFDKDVSRAWVGCANVRTFHPDQKAEEYTAGNGRKRKHTRPLQQAIEDARNAFKMSLEQRLGIYGFEKRYKGPIGHQQVAEAAKDEETQSEDDNQDDYNPSSQESEESGDSHSSRSDEDKKHKKATKPAKKKSTKNSSKPKKHPEGKPPKDKTTKKKKKQKEEADKAAVKPVFKSKSKKVKARAIKHDEDVQGSLTSGEPALEGLGSELKSCIAMHSTPEVLAEEDKDAEMAGNDVTIDDGVCANLAETELGDIPSKQSVRTENPGADRRIKKPKKRKSSNGDGGNDSTKKKLGSGVLVKKEVKQSRGVELEEPYLLEAANSEEGPSSMTDTTLEISGAASHLRLGGEEKSVAKSVGADSAKKKKKKKMTSGGEHRHGESEFASFVRKPSGESKMAQDPKWTTTTSDGGALGKKKKKVNAEGQEGFRETELASFRTKPSVGSKTTQQSERAVEKSDGGAPVKKKKKISTEGHECSRESELASSLPKGVNASEESQLPSKPTKKKVATREEGKACKKKSSKTSLHDAPTSGITHENDPGSATNTAPRMSNKPKLPKSKKKSGSTGDVSPNEDKGKTGEATLAKESEANEKPYMHGAADADTSRNSPGLQDEADKQKSGKPVVSSSTKEHKSIGHGSSSDAAVRSSKGKKAGLDAMPGLVKPTFTAPTSAKGKKRMPKLIKARFVSPACKNSSQQNTGEVQGVGSPTRERAPREEEESGERTAEAAPRKASAELQRDGSSSKTAVGELHPAYGEERPEGENHDNEQSFSSVEAEVEELEKEMEDLKKDMQRAKSNANSDQLTLPQSLGDDPLVEDYYEEMPDSPEF